MSDKLDQILEKLTSIEDDLKEVKAAVNRIEDKQRDQQRTMELLAVRSINHEADIIDIRKTK